MFQKVDEARFLDGEHETLRFWKEQQIFRRLQELNRGQPKWSFLDGPITANNPMGVHHAWGRTYKDAFQRYRAMTGHELRYQNGFDCQGLWVEVEVEKQLQLGTKNAIEQYGIEHFTRECKKRVLKFAARQTEQSIRLGYWMEWDDPEQLRKLSAGIGDDNAPPVDYTTARGESISGPAEQITARLGNPEWGGSYFTFSTENNETIWAFLKKCFTRAKIYRGHDVMPWSGRGGSAYSQMEVADGRKLTTHRSCFVRFPLLDKPEPEYLLVWTTTPWTLTSNVAAAVNPDLEYLKIRARKDGAVYYFAKENLNFKRLEKEFKEGFGRPEWSWPEGVGKLKSLSQIFKEQGGFEELETIQGADMIGWRYAGPFDELPAQQEQQTVRVSSEIRLISGVEAHRVIDGGRDSKGSANVVAGEGTGIVHIAPGCGDIDHKIGMELGLPVIAPLLEDGTYSPGFGPFTGKEAISPATADFVFEELKRKDLLVNVETYPHIYPHCWRTGDELVFRLVDEWFINMDWREEIKEVTRCINWLPDAIQGQARELEWLTTMRDWMISKKRFWGLALPIWIDPEDPSDFEVMGSLAELKARALDGGQGWEEFEAGGYTPHRPWIDLVKIRSRKSGKLLSRIEDVGNPWLDAGIVPFSTLNYQQTQAGNTSALNWHDWYPADLVLECFPGQFRNWFYSLLSLSTMMMWDADNPLPAEQKKPFKNLFGHRLVMNEQGQPMHKSDGTAIWFEEAAEQLGVDTIRWMYLAQNPAVDLKFGTRHAGEPVTLQTVDGPITATREGLTTCKVTSKPADDVRRQALIPLWNSYAFFVNYAVLDGFDPHLPQVPLKDRPEIDCWMLSRLQELTQTAHRAFNEYRISELMSSAAEFIDDLSNWYIRRNRRRFWKKRSATSASQPGASTTLSPTEVAEEIFRTYLSTQKQGLNRERTTLLREVFSTPESFTLDQLLVRLSRYRDGKRLHRADVMRGLKQLAAAGLITTDSTDNMTGGSLFHPAQPAPANTKSKTSATESAAAAWETDKLAAYQTLYEVLVTLCQLLAPSIPFLTERMYRNLVQDQKGNGAETGNPPVSVHLCRYPVVDAAKLDPDLNWKTQQVQKLVRMAHRLREAAELRVRQPLTELRFACSDPRQAAALEQYRDIIADELNVKEIVRTDNLDELVSYSFKPNLKTLGPRYGKLLNAIRAELATVDPAVMAPLRNGAAIDLTIAGEIVTLAPEDVMVSVEQASDWASADADGIQIALSTRLTPELIAEGMARDLIRQIQQLRKDADLDENQRIRVLWSPAGTSAVMDLASVIQSWEQTICEETRADTIEHVETAPLNAKNISAGEVQIALAIQSENA